MTREASSDFGSLQQFVDQYSLRSMSRNEPFAKAAKRMHKKLFGFLTFFIEAHSFFQDSDDESPIDIDYLRESGSDLGQALFCWIHGAYKPASTMLRSSIETYAKAVTAKECPAILVEKSLYKVFDLVADSTVASGELKRELFSQIRNDYSDLCAVTHSSRDTLVQINALNTFPHFDEKAATRFATKYSAVSERLIGLLLANHRLLFSQMHFRNRAIILDALPKSIKGAIFSE